MQEANKDDEQLVDEKDKSSFDMEYSKQMSRRTSFLHSVSRGSGSSWLRNSSRHSMSVSIDHPLTSDKPPEVPVRRIAYLNKPEVPVLVAGILSAIINGAIVPIFGILLSIVIKTFYEPPHELRKDSKFWALMFVVLGAVSLLAYPARTYFFGVAGCKLIRRIRLMCFEKVVNMEVSWFDELEHSSGVIGSRLSADAATIRALVGDALAQMVQDAASAVVGLVIAFDACWQLALIVLALIPLIGLNGYVQLKFMTGFSADAKVVQTLDITDFMTLSKSLFCLLFIKLVAGYV